MNGTPLFFTYSNVIFCFLFYFGGTIYYLCMFYIVTCVSISGLDPRGAMCWGARFWEGGGTGCWVLGGGGLGAGC